MSLSREDSDTGEMSRNELPSATLESGRSCGWMGGVLASARANVRDLRA